MPDGEETRGSSRATTPTDFNRTVLTMKQQHRISSKYSPMLFSKKEADPVCFFLILSLSFHSILFYVDLFLFLLFRICNKLCKC